MFIHCMLKIERKADSLTFEEIELALLAGEMLEDYPDTFDKWYDTLGDTDRANVLASLLVLRERGPMLSRPYADTVKNSCHSNMKELRIQSRGEPIRVFYAFDPDRRGVLLCAGNKTGNEKRFYMVMIPIADREFTAHLEKLKKE